MTTCRNMIREPRPLADDMARCHYVGCQDKAECARWAQRFSGGPQTLHGCLIEREE